MSTPDPAKPPDDETVPPPTPGETETVSGPPASMDAKDDDGTARLIGEFFGPYRVLSEIGRGGQGVLFLARHRELGTQVALKVLLRPNPRSESRFRQEAKLLARLEHPHLLKVTDLGDLEGLPFLAMKFVEGDDLRALHEGEKSPSPAEVVEVLAPIADALQYCHEQGVVHRDVKPANVLLERATGRPVLVDFGLAKRDTARFKLPEEDEGVSLAGEVKGTPAYMAPEQAGGEEDIGPLADVYGLGATLHYLLTGEHPFRAPSTLNVLAKVLRDPPPDPRAVNPSTPERLASLCMQALAKAPEDRPQSAAAFAAALRGSPRPVVQPEAAQPESAQQPLAPTSPQDLPSLSKAGLPRGLLAGALVTFLAAGGLTLAALGVIGNESPGSRRSGPEEVQYVWTGQPLPPQSPSVRSTARLVFHRGLEKLVLFGGYDNTSKTFFDDMWTWDGEEWERIEYGHDPDRWPLARSSHAMVYDPDRDRIVVFGGCNLEIQGEQPLGDQWEWDGEQWTERTGLVGPLARWNPGMVYDPDQKRIVLFGGLGTGKKYLNDLWVFDGASWKKGRTGPAPPPSPRQYFAMAYDSNRKRVVVYGGMRRGTFLDDLWEWNGQRWKEVAFGRGPGSLRGAMMVFDGRTVLLHGGADYGKTTGETWSWDGTLWSSLEQGPRRRGGALAWDPVRDVGLLFGGSVGADIPQGELWEIRPTR